MANTVSKRISDDILSCGVQIESNGKVDARPITKTGVVLSSAYGVAQFLKKTWRDTIKLHRPDLLEIYPDDELLELRVNPTLSISLMARSWEDNLRIIGPKATAGDLYLAHFLGPSTAKRVFYAPATADVEPIVGDKAVKANVSILRNKTCGEVRDWAARKMNNASGRGWIEKLYDPDEPLLLTRGVDNGEYDGPSNKIDPDDDTSPDDGIAPRDTTPHGRVNDQIASVQKALVDMGYHEVGLIDGAWGGATAGAIKAFLNDRGLDDWRADMSQRVIDEIARVNLTGWKRDIAPERKNVTPKDLARTNTTMRNVLRTKNLGFWGMISGAVVAVFNAVSTYFTAAWEMVKPVREVFGHIHWSVYLILFICICIFLYKNANQAEEDQTEAFHSRRLLR